MHPELVRQVISTNLSTIGSSQSRSGDLETTILQILRKELRRGRDRCHRSPTSSSSNGSSSYSRSSHWRRHSSHSSRSSSSSLLSLFVRHRHPLVFCLLLLWLLLLCRPLPCRFCFHSLLRLLSGGPTRLSLPLLLRLRLWTDPSRTLSPAFRVPPPIECLLGPVGRLPTSPAHPISQPHSARSLLSEGGSSNPERAVLEPTEGSKPLEHEGSSLWQALLVLSATAAAVLPPESFPVPPSVAPEPRGFCTYGLTAPKSIDKPTLHGLESRARLLSRLFG